MSLLAWSLSYTPCLSSAWWVPFCRIARPSAASISSKLQPGCWCPSLLLHFNRILILNTWMLLLYSVYHPLVVFLHIFWNCCHSHCTACTPCLSGWLSVHVFRIGLAISPVLSPLLPYMFRTGLGRLQTAWPKEVLCRFWKRAHPWRCWRVGGWLLIPHAVPLSR